MHVLLTDRLVCPRCGPPFGLILLAHRVVERRVVEGALGCPNCRESYPVEDGVADLRPPPRRPLDGPAPSPTPPEDAGSAGEEATRLGALLGVTEGPGEIVLAGPPARLAPDLAALLEEIEVVAVGSPPPPLEERPGVSRLVIGPGLPFFGGVLRGVALGGEAAGALLDEAARAVSRSGRVVVFDAPAGTMDRLVEKGFHPLLDEGGIVVAGRV